MIGTKIRDFRIKKRYSQNYLSKIVGIPQSTLSDIERNKYEPKLQLANNIADCLGVRVEDLLEDNHSVSAS